MPLQSNTYPPTINIHMKVTPYDKESSKTEQVREMFDAIAPKYDMLNHLLSMNVDKGWRKRLVKMVAAQNPRNILDVATGTADLAIALQRTLPTATITGADLSPEMVAVGRDKVTKATLPIELIVADAENLPFTDGSFEAITAAFGVRNFENTLSGLRDMHRVLTKTGSIYILEFSVPRPSLFALLYKFYFRHVLPTIGKIVSKDARAYTYLPESVEAFAYGEKFVSLLREAGFGEASYRELTGGIATIYTAKK